MKIQRCHDVISHGSFQIGAHHAHEETGQISGMRHWRDYVRRLHPTAKDFSISLREAFAVAEEQVPSIIVRRGLLGGNPCIRGTRIPVYMILDAVEYRGTLKGVLKSYPQLTIDQVEDAVRFSKIALECCVDH